MSTRERRAPAGRTGRRPGNPDTRDSILAAARETFAEVGFAGASVRRIATRAGVDPALIHHYFGTKDALFLATVQVPLNPGEMVDRIAAGGLDGMGHRLISTLLTVWESPMGSSLIAMLRTILADPASTRALQEFLSLQVVGRVIASLHDRPDEAEIRSSLVVSQILGVIVGRYVVGLEPLASVPTDQLVASIGPVLQSYIDDDLPEPVAADPVEVPAGLGNGERA